jgi:hypothetical protein
MQPRRQSNAAKILRSMLLAALVCLLPLTFSACLMGSASADGGDLPPVSATISVCDNGTPDCPPATSFGVNTARDLIITVAWQNLPPGNHVQTLEILIPAGGPYQVTQTTFNADGSPTNSYTTTRIFPVAATWIAQRQITGDWTVRVSLGGQVIASQVVQLNP